MHPSGHEDHIAIVAAECMSALGTTLDASWAGVEAGRSGLAALRRYAPEDETLPGIASIAYAGEVPLSFAELAGSAALVNKWVEPNFHALTRIVGGLVEAAPLDIGGTVDPQKVALLGATALAGQCSRELLFRSQRADSKYILNQCHNIPLSFAASRHRIEGPSFNVGSACASSGHALLIAGQMLRARIIDYAIVVGHEFPLLAPVVGGLSWINALYRRDEPRDRGYDDPAQASRPFSRDRRGFVLAEAVAGVVLTRRSIAERGGLDVRARLRGCFANADADHLTRSSPSNVARCIVGALADAACRPEDIELVSAHATSTPFGDRGELLALHEVFGPSLGELPVHALKSQLGHSLGASAMLAVTIAIAGLERGVMPPTLNVLADPELPAANVLTAAIERPYATTLVNSFGFGGTNVSLVIERSDG